MPNRGAIPVLPATQEGEAGSLKSRVQETMLENIDFVSKNVSTLHVISTWPHEHTHTREYTHT